MASDANRWAEAAPLPVARAGLAAAVHGGQIYAIAGKSKEGVTGQVTRLDPIADRWTPLQDKPTPVHDVGAVVIGGRIYVPGGCLDDGSPTDVLEIYDPGSDTWTTGPPLPRPLCAYAIAALEGKLYLFGGWDGSSYVNLVLAYDPEQQRWTTRTPMPTARGYAGAAAIEDQIYVVGGYDGRRDLAAVEAYAPARDNGQEKPWAVRRPLPEGRAAPGVVALQSKLYVIGGGWERGYPTAGQYDALTEQWTPFPNPTHGLWRNMAVVTVDTLTETRVYAIGGWDGDFVATTRVYTALYNVILPLQQR
jgi:N-acetylneuraminic acid mutarotase